MNRPARSRWRSAFVATGLFCASLTAGPGFAAIAASSSRAPVSPDSLGSLPDSLGTPADSLRAPADSLELPADSLGRSPDSLAAPSETRRAPSRLATPALEPSLAWELGRAAGDTSRFALEVGGSADYTNEIYFLDSLATPTLASRQRFDSPEARYAGVTLARLEGTRAARGTHYSFAQEVSYGDLLKRASMVGRWRQTLAPGWRLLIAPRAQYRRDRTLGRNFEEVQAAGTARLRRALAGGSGSVELGVLGDWLRTTGSGTALLLDRWSTGVTTAIEQADFSSWDGRIDYTLRGRVFPDSGSRDHYEHETLGRLRFGWGLANSLVLDGSVVRRLTMRTAPTSQDNFWDESGGVELTLAGAAPVSWPSRIEAEFVQFDVEDDVIYFNHRALRARTAARLQPAAMWTLELGPAIRWLEAPRAADESFVEAGGYAEFQSLVAGSLWNVTPSAGRRNYRGSSAASGADPFAIGRSSYAFVQLDALGDQRLPAGWRARVSGSARWELHEDSVENATSLYFSLDVRRLF